MKIKIVLLVVAALVIPVVAIFAIFLVSPLEPVPNDRTHLYYKNWTGVYIYSPRNCGFLPCMGPDLNLLRYSRISGARPSSFRIFHNGYHTGDILAVDDGSVFYGGTRVPDGDPSTVELVRAGAKTYVRDKNNVYMDGSITKQREAWEGTFLGGGLLKNENGLFINNNTQKPTKVDLPDPETFKWYDTRVRTKKNVDYSAEDKNFFYIENGGGFLVDPKPETQGFERLGCGYYRFQGRIFFNLFLLPQADPATFRVLRSMEDFGNTDDSCRQFYALDNKTRWEFYIPVRPEDKQRNSRIDELLKSPANNIQQGEKLTHTLDTQ